ncbi:unnamed protein product [Meganyctiphanes norvegica]|uniref:Fork-head domain-containing protein n=1 Tax=Meganyctiphanes norvegica TaxID=48144 RepID=A0AAV2R6N0_MEGNR
MDLYLPSTEPGLSLQEMIDCDIKCGIDMDFDGLDSVITSSDLNSLDFSGMSSLEQELDIKSFEPLFDPLEVKLMDVTEDHCNDLNTVNSWMNLSSMSNYSLDFENSIMVNPSAVLPTTLPSRVVKSEPMDSYSRNGAAHFTTSQITPTLFIKTEPHEAITTSSVQSPHSQSVNCTTVTSQVTVVRPQSTFNSSTIMKQQSPLISAQPVSHTTQRESATVMVNRTGNTPTKMLVQTPRTPTSTTPQQITIPASTTTTNSSSVIPSRTTPTTAIINNRYKSVGKPRKDQRPEERVFPKPAYSYSCLIALALKNSTTGSLPVSEIYSFMCEHFPYFRTAPNGWKNSVRHNLSLNKCFEKIEKPVVAGSNQRKGCLWALNPAKAHKMDEEVQKWSKKDLPGIKDAMQYPEVLESLERGEMKFESSGSITSCSEDEEDDEEVDPLTVDNALSNPTVGTVKIINPMTNPRIVTSSTRVQHIQQTITSVRTSVHNAASSTAIGSNNSPRTITTQAVKRPASSPSYVLPDSTMTEISLQANGALVDDLGNEIKIETDPPVHQPIQRGLVVRKLPGINQMRSATVRANYVYTPTLSSPHQHSLNRLVLTNAKIS